MAAALQRATRRLTTRTSRRGSAAQGRHVREAGPFDSIRQLQRTAGNRVAARLFRSPLLRRTSSLSRSAEFSADAGLASYVDASRGSGQPLPASVRAPFEARLGANFSSVRVHTDRRAAAAASEINARAFTHGADIHFGAGSFQPGSPAGDRLLAHELTHVLQQSASPHAARVIQREVQEQSFPGDGKVDDVRAGEHLLWNFEIGQHKLRAGHVAQIPRIASEIKNALSRDPTAIIDVEGQASFTGTRNDELSAKRAQAVKKALVDQGIDAARLNVIAVGSLKSLPGESQENFARSRAVRVITPPHLLLPVGPQPTPQTGACQAQAAGLTLEGAPVEVTFPRGFIRIHPGNGAGKPPGMIIRTGVAVSPPDCGTLGYVQNVQAFRQFVYKDRTRNTFQTAGFVLDTSDPYKTQVFTSSTPGTVVPTANDTPSQGVDAFSEGVINTVEARDDFRMFLMFTPKGGSRRPLMVGEWSWVGQLKNNKPNEFLDGDLTRDPSAARVAPTSGTGRATSEGPVLSPNVTSVNWVTDNAGASGGTSNTFAQSHRRLLDRLKPSADPK